jgi:hypothetical protein
MDRIFMKGFVATLFLTGFAVPALSSPVYLKCEIEVAGTMAPFTLTLNESTKKVDHRYEAGSLIETSGVFTADAVTYESTTQLGIGYIATEFKIDRVDLSFQRVSLLVITDPLLSDSTPNKPERSSGTCKLEEVPDRAF